MNIFKKVAKLFRPYSSERIFEYKDVWIHVLDFDDLNKKYHELFPDRKEKTVNGFTTRDGDIWVKYDYTKISVSGYYLPDTETLGHEFLHKLDFEFHK